MTTRLTALLGRIAQAVRARIAEVLAEPDRGSHAVEYAIGIGASAAVILGIFAAFKTGLANVVEGWFFG